MIKIYKKEHLKAVNPKYSKKIIQEVDEIITLLDKNYGPYRNVDFDLGGYVLILEDKLDVDDIKKVLLKGLEPEYTDIIEDYTSSLYLLSSDYSIVVIATEELSKLLLE
ncbi:hypothetical protein [Clostridium gasigenes]|uniref:Uncharacterized protein n=1 Tax=Clostridium gasigenes TaxID=94869 RepID=A0A1H0V4F9_9CLOT|nr:hypothetical protein [Clostridium gasigenes]SDP73233.1 hypothetical protein SAMN04488529_11439 [Clostridium gasigenes]